MVSDLIMIDLIVIKNIATMVQMVVKELSTTIGLWIEFFFSIVLLVPMNCVIPKITYFCNKAILVGGIVLLVPMEKVPMDYVISKQMIVGKSIVLLIPTRTRACVILKRF
jgi:hypothetical protein